MNENNKYTYDISFESNNHQVVFEDVHKMKKKEESPSSKLKMMKSKKIDSCVEDFIKNDNDHYNLLEMTYHIGAIVIVLLKKFKSESLRFINSEHLIPV